ncbi:hypothetical protein [Senegalia sp. (in: firmicutes)]|uniref:hypothetical protein n=1 Tax=Senegalia sp. (in: firmicutes) TaxID=1924098 RepID=UPI003F95ABDC
MNKKTNFNKEVFAALLEKAKGDRSINKYAEETSVSAAHISRFLRQMIDAPPTPETISKFADKAYNDVTYKDMMSAAGYIVVEENMVEEYSPKNRREEIRKIEQDITNIVISYLMNQEFKWSMEKPEGMMRFPDLMISLEDEVYKKWFFEFQVIRGRASMPFPIIHHFYSRLLTFELTPTDKFTLVIDNEKAFDFLFRRPPINLRANLYIMLVDTENRTVIKEEQICKYE